MGIGAFAELEERDAAGGNDTWDILMGHVIEVNESLKSHGLPGEIRKDDCQSGVLVRLLGIMRWARESSREDS